MNKLLILFTFTCSIYIYAIEDLGEVGINYEIQELDLLVQMQKGIQDINRSQQVQALAQSIRKSKMSYSKLPLCKTDKTYTIKNEVHAQAPVINLDGSYRIKQGDPLIVNNRISQNVCLADASTLNNAKMSAKFLANKTCNKILVSGMDFELFKKNYFPKAQVFPFHTQLANVLHTQCLPSKITAYKKTLKIQEFSMKGGN